jgi:hypothetical protein
VSLSVGVVGQSEAFSPTGGHSQDASRWRASIAGRFLVALYAAALRNNDQGISCSGPEKGPIEAGYGIHAIPAFHLPPPRGQIDPVESHLKVQ